jgi:hypothetical protein
MVTPPRILGGVVMEFHSLDYPGSPEEQKAAARRCRDAKAREYAARGIPVFRSTVENAVRYVDPQGRPCGRQGNIYRISLFPA